MIYYQSENIKMPRLAKRKVNAWIKKVIENHDFRLGDISYIFCDDEKILSVNREFLNHDYYTDIITFDDTEGKTVNGDIFISLDTVKSNSEKFGTDYEEEFYRVLIHGVLHLCGINDKGEGEREIMEKHENEALSILKQFVD